MRRKISRLLLSALCLLAGLSPLSAQDGEMSVRAFYLAETDLDANTAGTMMYDQNGEVCALIKLETSLDGFTFDVGSLGVRDVKRVGGEVWIYVPFGVRRITLSHPQLGVIRDYQFPVPIEKARTYIMQLNAKLGNRVYDNDHRQELILYVTPPDAEVLINGMGVKLDSLGRFTQELAFGVYDITVQRQDYHTVTIQQQIDNPEIPHYREIVMKQDYGWLSIPDYDGETLWVDNDKVQYAPGDVLKLKSGHYRIARKKPLYKRHETAIEIKDSVVFVLETPKYELYARTVEIASEGAELWVDSVKVGDSRWRGLVEYGQRTFYAKKRGHRSTEQTMEVTESGPESVSLAAPVPAYGTLSVAVDPSPAEVYVDGSFKGQAPDNIVLPIGDHDIEIRRSGMDTEYYHIDLPEGETISLDVHLITTLTVNMTAYADSTEVFIDGEYAGKTPFTVKIQAGKHHVVADSPQFKHYDSEVDFNNPGTMMLKMKPRYTHKGAFYLDLQAAVPGSFYIGGAMGFYAANFNMEALALYGMSATAPVYWNATDASAEPSVFTYKPLVLGARMGLEIPFSMGMSLTPRVGANLVNAMGTAQGNANFDASKACAMSAVVDLRFTARLAGPVYFKLQPEYDIKVQEGDLFKVLSEASPAVKSWADGFKCSFGFSFIF